MKTIIAVALCSAALSACAPSPMATAAATSPPPYSRSAFGDGWAPDGHGCDTRDAALRRDIEQVSNADRCGPLAGTLRDPYSGTVVVGPTRHLDADHLVPLELAWSEGAWRWSKAQRVRFANDLDNLVTTTARENRSKGSRGLDRYLPKHDPCGYARHFDEVADRYGLGDSTRDSEVTSACR